MKPVFLFIGIILIVSVIFLAACSVGQTENSVLNQPASTDRQGVDNQPGEMDDSEPAVENPRESEVELTAGVSPTATIPADGLDQEVTIDPFAQPDCSQLAPGQPEEVEVRPIGLAGPLSTSSAEISGMDWYGEYLIILPQYFDHAEGRVLYAVPKSVILGYLQGSTSTPLEVIRIPVEDQFFGAGSQGFEGYEAITFKGDRVYLTVELSTGGGMAGYLISGEIDSDLSRVVLDIEDRQPIPLQQQIDNLSDETILEAGDRLITIFEANGAVDNPFPSVHVFDTNLHLVGELPFPTIEYRVTDATRLDSENNFWVVNTYTLGAFGLTPQEDMIGNQFGEGCTHAKYGWVERLVELHYDPDSGITFTDSPPIQLVLKGYVYSRNWEGIVRLDDLGFLIVTDEFPETILGFVPLP